MTYLRFDLAMGPFDTLGFIKEQIRTQEAAETQSASVSQDDTPLTAQLMAADCLVQ